jgi:hypothetical protein
MRSHKSPSAPGRTPWLGAGLVEGPDLSDRHGLFLGCFGRHAFRAPAARNGISGPGGRLREAESPGPKQKSVSASNE